MVAIYIKKDHTQYHLCDSGVYSREIVNMFFCSQVFRLVENLHWDLLRHHKYDRCQTLQDILLIELYLFIPHFVTLTIFQGHSSVKQF